MSQFKYESPCPTTGLYTLCNGYKATIEFIEDFTRLFSITPNEFLEMGKKELTIERDGYISTIEDTGTSISVTRNKRNNYENL